MMVIVSRKNWDAMCHVVVEYKYFEDILNIENFIKDAES